MWRGLAVFVVIAVVLVGVLVWTQREVAPLVVSGVIEADDVRVGSRVGGRVAAVLVEEGQEVSPGETLYRLDPFDLIEQHANARAVAAAAAAELARLRGGYRPEELAQARARRDLAQAELDKRVAGARPQEIAAAEARVRGVEAELAFARQEFARVERLQEARQAADIEYEAGLRTVKVQEAEVSRAQQELALLQAGTRVEEIAEARATLAEAGHAVSLLEAGYRAENIARASAEVDAASARVAMVERQLAEMEVDSPCACVVEAINLEPGDLVSANAPTVTLLDRGRLWVRSYIPEGRLGEVGLNSAVPLSVDSFPDERFEGRVVFIASKAEFTPRNVQTPEERSKQVFRIRVVIESGLERLRPGMIGDLRFDERGE